MTAIETLLRETQARPLLVAHRGNRAQAPENSLAAFRLALAQGAHALETDLRLTKDRHLVCLHDATVDRTSDGSGAVTAMTLAEIKRLRLRGPGDDVYPDERVPTLGELLEAFGRETYFMLELKTPPDFTGPEDVALLIETLEKHDALERVVIVSFSKAALDLARAAGAPFPVAPIEVFNPWPPKPYPMVGVWWPMLVVNPFYVAICRRRGQFFCPLDPRPEPRLRYYRWLGVDCLLSDDPEKTAGALASIKWGHAPGRQG